jgi:hypothetical protein
MALGQMTAEKTASMNPVLPYITTFLFKSADGVCAGAALRLEECEHGRERCGAWNPAADWIFWSDNFCELSAGDAAM